MSGDPDGELPTIALQSRTRALTGRVEYDWFENEHVGLARTRFHRVVVPFEPFDSGLEYVQQPESTELVVEWVRLDVDDPAELDGVDLAADGGDNVEASIYLGAAHNPVRLEAFRLIRAGDGFRVSCVAVIGFEFEGVAKDERLEFVADVVYRGEA